MQELEPYFNWRHLYQAEQDPLSPFFGNEYSEFEFSNTVYNHYIHPQWDFFGSSTLYLKVLFVDYELGFAIIEFIGEWNDVLENDIMLLKDQVLKWLMQEGVYKFILLTEQVMNLHTLDQDYYQEWNEEVESEGGWIVSVNTPAHVEEEWRASGMSAYLFFYEMLEWRTLLPEVFFEQIQNKLQFFLD